MREMLSDSDNSIPLSLSTTVYDSEKSISPNQPTQCSNPESVTQELGKYRIAHLVAAHNAVKVPVMAYFDVI